MAREGRLSSTLYTDLSPTSLTRSRHNVRQLLHTRSRSHTRASSILGVARYRRVPLGERAAYLYVYTVRCAYGTCVGAMGPTADAARIVHGAVCSRLKYWLTKWGSSNAFERKEGLHQGGLQVIVCGLRATLSQGRFSLIAVVRAVSSRGKVSS